MLMPPCRVERRGRSRRRRVVDGDDLLGPVFNEVAQVNWPEHLAKLTAFWCRALFGIAE